MALTVTDEFWEVPSHGHSLYIDWYSEYRLHVVLSQRDIEEAYVSNYHRALRRLGLIKRGSAEWWK